MSRQLLCAQWMRSFRTVGVPCRSRLPRLRASLGAGSPAPGPVLLRPTVPYSLGGLTDSSCGGGFRPTPLLSAARFASGGQKDSGKDHMQMPGPPPVHPFILEVGRGLGQVVFCNSSLSGAFIAAGLLYSDPWLACMALTGCTSATAAARLAGVEKGSVTAGLLGYNGALVGCAFAAYKPGLATIVKLSAAIKCSPFVVAPTATVLMTVWGGAVSALLAEKLGSAMKPMPQWTLAFNALVLAVLGAFALARPRQARKPAAAAEDAGEVARLYFYLTSPGDLVLAALSGVAQIFVTESAFAGLLILMGIFTFSPGAAAATLAGSTVGTLCAAACGVDMDEVEDGLWGYNSALTALAVSIFFVPVGGQTLALGCGGAAAAALTTVALKTAMGSVSMPCLTLPFCAVASGCFLLGGRVPGLVRARVPHSPEANLKAYYAR